MSCPAPDGNFLTVGVQAETEGTFAAAIGRKLFISKRSES